MHARDVLQEVWFLEGNVMDCSWMMMIKNRLICWPLVSAVLVAGSGCSGGESENHETALDMSQGIDMEADLGVGMRTPDMDAPDLTELDLGQDMLDMEETTGCVIGTGEEQTYAVQEWSVTVNHGTGAWQVSGPGGEFQSFAAACDDSGESLYRVASGRPNVNMSFGAWKINMNSTMLAWRGVQSSSPDVVQSGDQLALSWRLEGEDGATVSLVFAPDAEFNRNLSVQLVTDWSEARAGEFSLRCEADESFFGLGTQVTGMDLRGGKYPLWTQEQGIDKLEGGGVFPLQNIPEAAYAPMGVLHSSQGWSAILRSDSFTEVDLCKGDESRVKMSGYSQLPGWVFVAGDTPKERLSAITEYTGRIDKPALWTFAPWNDTVGGPARVAAVASALRDNDIPSSAIWSEDWIGGELTENGYRLSYAWEWDPETYPELPADIDRLHAQGFAFFGYFNTFVVSTTRMWQEGMEGDYLIKNDDGEVYTFLDPGFRTASMIDLTNPEAREWLGGYMQTAASELKIDGWMADFTEWLPHDAVLSNGEDAWNMHNKFPLLWQQLNRDVFEQVHEDTPGRANDWVFWVRSGWASTQGGTGGVAPTLWGGDQNTDWGYDDGMPSVIPIGAHVGMSGVPIFGSDISGYSWINANDQLSTKELFFRWSALGAFHPLMRTHQGAAKCLNWSFDRDADTIAHYRRYASIHTLLLPYFDVLSREAQEFGWPITRHPFMVYPEDRSFWSDMHYVHFLGDDVLVAPVLEEGATARELYVSADVLWWDLLGGDTGSDRVTSGLDSAPVTEIPVFVRGGTVLPLLGEVVDSFYGAEDENITDLEDIAGTYRVALYGSESGEVKARTFGDESVTVSATGVTVDWMQSALDVSAATVDGDALVTCDVMSTSCVGDDYARVVVEAGQSALLEVGGAQVTISAAQGDVTVMVYRGADAFGEFKAATPLEQGLDSMAPPVCDSSKD